MTIQKLINQRNSVRNIIENFMQKIEEIKTNYDSDGFDIVLESLEAKTKQLKTLNEKIAGQLDGEEMGEENLQAEMHMLDLDIKLRKLRTFRDQRETENTPQLPIGGSTSSGSELNANALPFQSMSGRSFRTNSAQFHRLPKLSLPTFSGDILKWQSFWDCFESTIHQNTDLTDVQKFAYLQSQLEGSAARTIEGFALTHDNYVRAVDLLRERFGRQHKITHATMQALVQLPVPRYTLTSLRDFQDRMETYIRGLESMGQQQHSYGTLLVPIILDKMPCEIQQNLARVNDGNDWQLEELRRALSKEIKVLEAGSRCRLPEDSDPEYTASFYTAARRDQSTRPRQTTGGGNHGNQSIDQPVSSVVGSAREQKSVKCAFCDGAHKSKDCKKFKDSEARLQQVKVKRLCFNCLRNHPVAKCTSQSRCQICKKKHHTAICKSSSASVTTPQNQTPEVTIRTPETAVLHSSTSHVSQGVLLKTAICAVRSGILETDACILFDEGAQRSFITEALADELQIPRTGTEEISLSTFGSNKEKIQHLDTATVQVVTDRKEEVPIKVLIVPTIATPMNNELQFNASKLPYLKGLKLAHPVTGDRTFTISMLIGANHYWDIVEDCVIRGDGPTAMKSKIGYLLSGPMRSNHVTNTTNYVCYVNTHARTDAAIEKFWKLESIGIEAREEEQEKTDYLKQYQQASIGCEDSKYTVALPWKTDHEPLPSNYQITKKRTESTVRRLSTEPEMLQKYGEIIAEQERRGFIEKVDEAVPTSYKVHYIPHHPVRKDSTTTPIRIVYDCSCHQSGEPSLNDCLESTPPVLNELTSILMRFRMNTYAVTTDIEKAFLHIALHEKDRDVTRFLWLSDPADPHSPLCTYRFKAVLFGATCSPFILNATILKHLDLNATVSATETLKRDLYVDNVLSSFTCEQQLLTYFREARDLMTDANMNLRSWSSNSQALRHVATQENVLDKDEKIKVLGMRWKPEEDMMTFAERDILELETITKRDILKYSSRIYDPLGLLSPVTVRAKLLLQQLWKGKYEWDTPLPAEFTETWNQLARDLNTAIGIELSRKYLPIADDTADPEGDGATPCLHIFVDASIKAYGAAVYVSSRRDARLVMAKNRVAPLKGMTLPQLELMAAVIGARLATHVQQSLDIEDVTFWSDSQIVLCWLQSTKPLKRFVRNRVQEIETRTENHTWRYCPTDDNPADLLTRGIPANQLIDSRLWNAGPSWITNQRKWPKFDIHHSSDHILQLLSNSEENETTNVNSLQCTPVRNILQIIDICRYSDYPKLLRVTAYILRFIRNCRNPQNRLHDVLTTEELKNAERSLLKACQETTYQEEVTTLKSGATCRLALVRQLRLFIDENGLLRCGGRIHNAPLSDVTRFPFLLPRKHQLTRLIVLDAHKKQLHAGVNGTVTQIRQKYWIPAIKQCVNIVIRKCVTCRKVQGKAYAAPDPPPLPKVRVEESPPFSVTGVDYTGALTVRDPRGHVTKAYICLFTCASTRAVHLEVVPDLSQESFLQAFRRFAGRRSLPRVIISDNGTTFVAASQHLKRLFNSTVVKETLTGKGTEWRFIPNRAPWYGGWWERLIGLTKSTLKKILGRALVTIGTLQTVVTEIEAMLNDRPLTSLSPSYNDLEPLTPSHLLYGRRLTSLPYNTLDIEVEPTSPQAQRTALTKHAKLQSALLDQYWRRWRTEYLTALRETHRATGTNTQTITAGDVVQIHDDGPRGRWKLGVVQELIPGRDDRIRAAIVRTAKGQTSSRPIVKLYPVELCDRDT